MGSRSCRTSTWCQSVVLYGDPSKEGLFALRLKLPKGYHSPRIHTLSLKSSPLFRGEPA